MIGGLAAGLFLLLAAFISVMIQKKFNRAISIETIFIVGFIIVMILVAIFE